MSEFIKIYVAIGYQNIRDNELQVKFNLLKCAVKKKKIYSHEIFKIKSLKILV